MRPLTLLAITGSLALFPSARAGKPAAPRLPNIVYVMGDDLGARHLGCYGGDKIRTPHIDRLAAQGMKFTRVYAGNNVCAPSRSVLMQGMHSGHTSVRGNSGGISLLASDVTVAELLKKAGYATGGFGKWGLGDAGTDGAAYHKGFDEFFGYYDQVHAHSFYPPYLWHNDKKYRLPANSGSAEGLTGQKRGQYSGDEIAAKAMDFIRREKDRPLFCYVPITIPHFELAVPEDSLKEYAGKWPEPHPYVTEKKHYMDQPQPRAALAAMVTRLDGYVGRIMDLLKELKLDDNTIVFFTSDNGAPGGTGTAADFFQPNGPLRDYKGSMYEGGLRVPMIVRWPGKIGPGTVSNQVWYFADLMPTLAELAGAEPPRNTDGISVVPTLLGEPGQKQHEFLYWESAGYQGGAGLIRPGSLVQAVRMGDWKGIRWERTGKMELYDLARDMSETTDVSAKHTDVVAKIEAIMKSRHIDPPPQLEPETPAGRAFR